ncbi:BTAD domain-containing putative transcriptional regulator [Streptomyces sp. PmtA]|uniref:AfsR/SARP family transcriptional regulator n=1 Tax=Streptomyces sp. PmtA TaxID=3074275 RepID=UPI003014226D
MEFRVLGPVEVRRHGSRVPLSGTKLHTVLAALLLAREEVVSDDRLSRLLWGWAPPATASAQLYTYVSRLRKILGDDILIDRRPPGYAMAIGNSSLDLIEFQELDREGREALSAHDHEKAGDLLRSALARWNGPPLANTTDHLAAAEATCLTEARAVTLEHRIAADLALGRHEEITVELTGLVAEFPLRERIRCQLMTALCRCGRQADAIHLYHHGRAVLAEELGVDPGEELQATYRALLDGSLVRHAQRTGATPEHAGRRQAEPDTHGVPATLPPDTVDFTGRERELGLLSRALAPDTAAADRPRRVLVTGMAGVGKTALAVHAAHRCKRHFPDGQLYADLRAPDGTARPAAGVLLHLLRALGLAVGSGTAEDTDELVRLYRERTGGRRLLILLDNAASAAQLGPLLPNTPEPAVLVTGRTALPTVAGAHTVALDPLEDGPALQVLAAAAGPDRIAAAPGAAAVIVEHCAGLPLALRIAGTRIAARPALRAGPVRPAAGGPRHPAAGAPLGRPGRAGCAARLVAGPAARCPPGVPGPGRPGPGAVPRGAGRRAAGTARGGRRAAAGGHGGRGAAGGERRRRVGPALLRVPPAGAALRPLRTRRPGTGRAGRTVPWGVTGG